MQVFDLTARKKKTIRKRRMLKLLEILCTICMVLNIMIVSIAVASLILNYITHGEVPSVFTSRLATKQLFTIVLGLWICSSLKDLF